MLSDAALDRLMEADYERWGAFNDVAPTAAHVAVIRAAPLVWGGAESGAVAFDPGFTAPGGDAAAALARVAAVLDEDELVELLLDLPAAVAAFCRNAEMAPGRYEVAGSRVDLTAEHVGLIRAMQWEMPNEDEIEEFAGDGGIPLPMVDPKRPYGEMSDYPLDLHRVLGWPAQVRDERGFIRLSDGQRDRATVLHRESLAATRAFFANASLRGAVP